MNITVLLTEARKFSKCYDAYMRKAGAAVGLSLIEVNIITFLQNNPGHDTVSDIADLRKLPKSNVSTGVDLLVGKGFLSRSQDKKDRRRAHLSLTPEAAETVESMRAAQNRFFSRVFRDFTEEDERQLIYLLRRLSENIDVNI